MTQNQKHYLGDGAYAEFDGFGLWVTTENGIEVTNRIYLEPEVMASLLRVAGQYFDRDKMIEILGGTAAQND